MATKKRTTRITKRRDAGRPLKRPYSPGKNPYAPGPMGRAPGTTATAPPTQVGVQLTPSQVRERLGLRGRTVGTSESDPLYLPGRAFGLGNIVSLFTDY